MRREYLGRPGVHAVQRGARNAAGADAPGKSSAVHASARRYANGNARETGRTSARACSAGEPAARTCSCQDATGVHGANASAGSNHWTSASCPACCSAYGAIGAGALAAAAIAGGSEATGTDGAAFLHAA